MTIKLITKKFKSFFSLKDKNLYPACQIYKGACVCEETYMGETTRNVNIRWNKHENIRKESEHVKYLRENLNQDFKWETFLWIFQFIVNYIYAFSLLSIFYHSIIFQFIYIIIIISIKNVVNIKMSKKIHFYCTDDGARWKAVTNI